MVTKEITIIGKIIIITGRIITTPRIIIITTDKIMEITVVTNSEGYTTLMLSLIHI